MDIINELISQVLEERKKSKKKGRKKKQPAGLWANIHARRKAGKPKRKPGDPNYPKTLDIDESTDEKLDEKTSKSKKSKDQNGDGVNDFTDVKIARMKASGMSHKQAVAKAQNEKVSKKVLRKGHEIGKSIAKKGDGVDEPYAVGMSVAKKMAKQGKLKEFNGMNKDMVWAEGLTFEMSLGDLKRIIRESILQEDE